MSEAPSPTPGLDLDLDALAPEPLRVKLDGRVWELPGGPKSQTVVEIAALFDSFDKRLKEGDAEGVQRTSDQIRAIFHDLFNERTQAADCYTTEDGEKLLDLPELNDEQMAKLFGLLVEQITGVAAAPADGETEGERPTSPQPASTAKPRSSGRSRQSSRKRPSAQRSASSTS